MAFQFIPLGIKAGIAALRGSKLLSAVRGGAAMTNVANATKTAASTATRFAGEKGAALGTRLAGQFKDLSAKEAMFLFGPDVVMGGAAGAMTPGDLGDKAMVGLGSAAGGVVGGVAGRSFIKPGSPIGIGGYAADMVGSTAGDMAGYEGANAAVRARNGGMTPAEAEMMAYEEEIRQQAVAEFLNQGRY